MTESLIIIPDGASAAQPQRKPTKIRIIESDRIIADARQALRAPAGEQWYMTLQIGVVEAPGGYIVVDEEGGHMTFPMTADETITLLVWSRTSKQPVCEAPVSIRDLLRYTNKTMPVADFISNRDGMEERWEKLLITLRGAGVFDTEADEKRRRLNNERLITGGAQPFDKKKAKLIETE